MKKKLIKSCIWSVVLCRSETWTIGKNGERVVNPFSWRGMLKIKWTGRITNDEVFQRVKKERLLLKISCPQLAHTLQLTNPGCSLRVEVFIMYCLQLAHTSQLTNTGCSLCVEVFIMYCPQLTHTLQLTNTGCSLRLEVFIIKATGQEVTTDSCELK
jgi:hypothetical protein